MFDTYLYTYYFWKDIFTVIVGGISLYLIYLILLFLKVILEKIIELIRNQNELTRTINKSLNLDIPEILENEKGGAVEFLSDMTEEEYEESIQPVWYKRLFIKKINNNK